MRMWVMAAAAAAALVGGASAASAADFSFTGTFTGDDDVQFFNFAVGATSDVTLRTWSYAGGTNAAGDLIARGGFDPILSLYDSAGDRVGQNDDGGCSLVAADAVSNRCWDTFFQATLDAGSYTVAVTQFSNFAPDHIPGLFPGSGRVGFEDVSEVQNNPRDGHWAFDVLNVASATTTTSGAPEPAAWALMIGGFGLAGAALRRRRAIAA